MVTVRDVMSTDLVTLSPDLSLRDAIELLVQKHISGAPVVAGDRAVGVISASDVLAFETATPGVPASHPERPELDELAAAEQWEEGAEAPGAYFSEFWEDAGADVTERIQDIEGPEWDVLGEHTVAEAMTLGMRCVRAGATLPEAAAYMLRHGIHRALVLDDEKLVGIITASDILRAVAEGRLGP